MKFYKYWAVGEATVPDARRPWKLRAYGGSNEGVEDAKRRAHERAKRAAEELLRSKSPGAYAYADRPLREEVVQEIHHDGQLVGLITRNSYGALVLNSSRAMFVDVDVYPPSDRPTLGKVLRDMWNAMRGRSKAIKRQREQRILAHVENVGRSRPDIGFRIYRTAGGFRLLVTSDIYDPKAAEAIRILEAFGADPLYIRLCKSQECFRARLSAKFWRCGADRPPSRFPWANAAEEKRYRQWEQDYHRLANSFATCQFVDVLGERQVDDAVQPILETHDRLTLHDGAPLA